MKSKPIVTSPSFPKYIAAKVKQYSEPADTAATNVTARLFNSNPVKAALADVLANVQRELGVAPDEVPQKKKRLRAADYARQPVPNVKKQKPALAVNRDTTSGPNLAQTGIAYPDSTSRSLSAATESALDSDGESMDFDKYESRLADSEDGSDSDSSEESNDVQSETEDIRENSPHGEIVSAHNKSQPLVYQPSGSLSPSPTASDASSRQSSELQTAPTPKVATTAKQATKQTTFLPSLIGGYWSGSESAPEDEDPSVIKPRKNRRGQQERRAIWEKKYGRAAKHLQGQPPSGQQNRDEGWDARRGASDGRGKRGRGRGAIRGGRPPKDFASGANDEAMGRKRAFGSVDGKQKANDGPLHPSWEAKKRAKEKAGSSVVAFQGKKVVFD